MASERAECSAPLFYFMDQKTFQQNAPLVLAQLSKRFRILEMMSKNVRKIPDVFSTNRQIIAGLLDDGVEKEKINRNNQYKRNKSIKRL